MISGLAFFDFDNELANYCMTNLRPTSDWGSDPEDPDLIRVDLNTLTYYFAKVATSRKPHQRKRLPKEVFYQLVLLPTFEARCELNKAAYKDLGYGLSS